MLTPPLIAPRIGLFYYIRCRAQENSPAATGNLPKASQANLCLLLAPGSQLIGGDPSPVTWKEPRPCHGLLRHLSKCVSVSKSMATCQPMATCRQNSNCYLASCFASPTRLRPAHNRDCPRIGADGLS